MIFFPSLLYQELSQFHWKEALYSFSLAYANRQHHCFCTLRPLLNKIQVTWKKPCYSDRGSDSLDGGKVAGGWVLLHSVDTLDKGGIHILRGMEQEGLRSSYYSEWCTIQKMMNYLSLEFTISHFQSVVDHGHLKLWEVKLCIGGTTVQNFIILKYTTNKHLDFRRKSLPIMQEQKLFFFFFLFSHSMIYTDFCDPWSPGGMWRLLCVASQSALPQTSAGVL